MSPFVRRGDIILKKPQIYLNPNRTWLECSLHGPLQNAYFFCVDRKSKMGFFMYRLNSIKYIVSKKNYFFHFPIWCYAKAMPCRGGHLWFPIDTKKNKHFVKDHAKNIPAMYIPNIIDLSGTKKFWWGQASLRRSGRKNQTKTMSPFVRRGDIILKKPQIYLNPNRTWLECSLH
jgi:hypothetical protein